MIIMIIMIINTYSFLLLVPVVFFNVVFNHVLIDSHGIISVFTKVVTFPPMKVFFQRSPFFTVLLTFTSSGTKEFPCLK